MEDLILQAAALAYLLAGVGYVASVVKPGDASERSGPLVLAIAFFLHTVFLGVHAARVGLVPAATATEGLTYFSWLVVAVFLPVQRRIQLNALGAVISPLVFVLTFGASLLAGGEPGVPEPLRSPWLPVHITLAFLGHAVFGLAFAVSCIYLLQGYLLKSKGSGWMIRQLPALEKLDRLNHVFLAVGFPLLTLGILTGGVWALNAYGRFWSWEPREVLAVLAWLLYAGLLQMRMVGGMGGRQAARLTIVGFCILMVSYLGVNFLPLSGRHGLGGGL